MKAADLLAGDDLAVDVALLDQQRSRPHVANLHRQQLLRRPQPLVGDQRHHRRRVELLALQQPGPDRLDLRRRQAHDRALAPAARLLHLLHRVRTRHPAPPDRVLEHALQDHHRHPHRVPPNAGRLQVGPEVRHHLGRDLAQLVEARGAAARGSRAAACSRAASTPPGSARRAGATTPRQLLDRTVRLVEQHQLAQLLAPLDLAANRSASFLRENVRCRFGEPWPAT